MRIFRQYRFCTVNFNEREYFWYNTKEKRWLKNNEALDSDSKYLKNCVTCRSVKAFNRFLETCPYGVKFRLVSRFIGHDIIGTGKNKNY